MLLLRLRRRRRREQHRRRPLSSPRVGARPPRQIYNNRQLYGLIRLVTYRRVDGDERRPVAAFTSAEPGLAIGWRQWLFLVGWHLFCGKKGEEGESRRDVACMMG